MKSHAILPMTMISCLLVIILTGSGCKKKEINLPVVESVAVSKATTTTAVLGGWIADDGGGEITDRGVSWSQNPSPTIEGNHISDGSGMGNFTVTITGLTANTLYHVRTYASNAEGTAYGIDMFLKTMFGTVTDIDGNVYPTVKVGNQEWMAENLKVTRYRNGDPVVHITGNTQWEETEAGAYCWNENEYETYGQYYGALYNRYSIIDPREICPAGWHIPTNAEWQTLIDFLGGSYFAAGKLKSAVTTSLWHPLPHPHWNYPNMDATNESGFSGFPGGFRSFFGGDFNALGATAYWWSASLDEIHGQGIHISINPGEMGINRHGWNSGLSVRCLRD